MASRTSAAKVTILPGHAADLSACTFALEEEDHTMGNVIRYILMKNPDVEFCGYSAPHPSEYKIHLRVQMFDHKSALDALLKGLCDLEDLFTVLQEKYAEDFNKGQYETITPEEINWDEVKAKAQANKEAKAKAQQNSH